MKKKIDFIDELETMGFVVKIPKEVIEELKDLKKGKKTNRKDKDIVCVALEMLQGKNIKKIRLGGRYVDEGLIKKGQEGVYIATLDREVKKNVKNKIVLLTASKKFRIIRD